MNAREYLDSVFMLNVKINSLQIELDLLNDMLGKLNKELTPDQVQTSGSKDPLGDTVVKIIDLQREINILIDRYIDEFKNVKRIIECVENPKEYDLLHKHYIQGMSWTDISNEWDNSNTWVHEIKNNAFATVQKILDEKAI